MKVMKHYIVGGYLFGETCPHNSQITGKTYEWIGKRSSQTKCSLKRVVLSCTAYGENVLGKANTAISKDCGVIIYSAWFVHRPETFDVWLDKCLCFKFNLKVKAVVYIVPNDMFHS